MLEKIWRRIVDRYRRLNSELDQVELELRKNTLVKPLPPFPEKPYKTSTIVIFAVFAFFVALLAGLVGIREAVRHFFR